MWGVENEEAGLLEFHWGPSPHHEFRHDSAYWNLIMKVDHQIRSDYNLSKIFLKIDFGFRPE